MMTGAIEIRIHDLNELRRVTSILTNMGFKASPVLREKLKHEPLSCRHIFLSVRDGRPIMLTTKAFNIGTIATIDTLQEETWGQ